MLQRTKNLKRRLTATKRNLSSRTKLEIFLLRNKADFESLAKKRTKTVAETSKATGIRLNTCAKALVFANEQGKPFIVILRADHQVNERILQKRTGYKSIKIAPIMLAQAASGYPAGGIPPIGHKIKMPAFIDKRLLKLKQVWCGGGSKSKLVRLKVKDILRLSNAKVASFSVAGNRP